MQKPLQPFHMGKAGGNDKAVVHDGVWTPSLELIGAVVGTAAVKAIE